MSSTCIFELASKLRRSGIGAASERLRGLGLGGYRGVGFSNLELRGRTPVVTSNIAADASFPIIDHLRNTASKEAEPNERALELKLQTLFSSQD